MTQRKHEDRPIGRMGLSVSKPKHPPSLQKKRGRPASGERRARLSLCQIRVDDRVLDTVKNAVTSAKLGGDFHYGNVSDFIRGALADYKKGLKLTEPALPGDRGCVRPTTVWLDEELYSFWRSLPIGGRREILERALRTKLRRG